MKDIKHYSRRQFLRVASISTAATLLAACGESTTSNPTPTPQAVAPTNTPQVPTPTSAPVAAAESASATAMEAVSEEEALAQAKILVGDVTDFVLSSNDWSGQYGYVTLQMHEALHNGQMIYYISTDTNDPTYATENQKVFVPLLGALLSAEGMTSRFYTFENGTDDQLPVMSTIPGMDEYSAAMHVHHVTFSGDPVLLDSVEAIEAAEEAGDITVEAMNLILNNQVIQWGDEHLVVDTKLEETLGEGQLFEAPDLDNKTVIMKLHQCYPGSRYILTDSSHAGMAAERMFVPASVPTQGMLELGSTDEIWIFHNGIPGSGVAGFQPAIFDHEAGNPAWSPFWDHRGLEWNEGIEPRLLTNSDEIRAAIEAGDMTEYLGVKPLHPNGFVVNCPAPILAPNTFKPA